MITPLIKLHGAKRPFYVDPAAVVGIFPQEDDPDNKSWIMMSLSFSDKAITIDDIPMPAGDVANEVFAAYHRRDDQ